MKNSVFCLGVLIFPVLLTAACEADPASPDAMVKDDPALYFVRGYRSENDPCKLTGETAYTNQFLGDASDLVSCPADYEGAREFIRTTGAKVVAHTKSYTLYTVPRR